MLSILVTPHSVKRLYGGSRVRHTHTLLTAAPAWRPPDRFPSSSCAGDAHRALVRLELHSTRAPSMVRSLASLFSVRSRARECSKGAWRLLGEIRGGRRLGRPEHRQQLSSRNALRTTSTYAHCSPHLLIRPSHTSARPTAANATSRGSLQAKTRRSCSVASSSLARGRPL